MLVDQKFTMNATGMVLESLCSSTNKKMICLKNNKILPVLPVLPLAGSLR